MSYEHNPDHPLEIAYPYFPPQEQTWLQSELTEILNGRLSMGPRVRRFQQEFAAYCGAPHGFACTSGTASLEAALSALAVGPGDEVLVPVETFIATGMAVHLAGARPVFTEISPDTFSMDFDDAWARITERTRGAIVVHFGGMVDPRFVDFVARMRATGRFVIEDSAHAHGAELHGRRSGSLADAACFSFYPTKIMTTGEGGMLVTVRDDIAQVVQSLQSRGRDLSSENEQYAVPARNNRFTEIAAAMGLSQLRCLPEFLARRRRVAELYDKALGDSHLIRPLRPPEGSVPSYWRYVALPASPLDRPALRRTLDGDRIAIDWAYDPPLHLQPVFRRLLGTRAGMLPRSEDVMSRHICLPIHARMRDIDAAYVAERLLFHMSRPSPAARARP